jgi:hypothetical protein
VIVQPDLPGLLEGFFQFLNTPPTDGADRRHELERHLDLLSWVSHEIPDDFDQTAPDLDFANDYASLRARFTEVFPELNTTGIADPLDDLTDLVLDLKEIHQRWTVTSPADARFHFHLLFRAHWGLHLRRLQLFLMELDR